MGCLMEFIFEVLLEGIGYCYIKLMTLMVPEKSITDKYRLKIKQIATIVAVVVALALILGATFWAGGATVVGKTMVFIALGIMGTQIGLGLIMWILTRRKK